MSLRVRGVPEWDLDFGRLAPALYDTVEKLATTKCQRRTVQTVSRTSIHLSRPSAQAKTSAAPPMGCYLLAMSCETCGGTGWLVVRETYGETAKPCPDCRGMEKLKRRLREAAIPARYADRGFDVFSIHHPKQEQALRRAIRFVESYPSVERGLLFVGPCGVGKTHLAVAILRTLIEQKHVKGRFVDESELLRRLQYSYGPDSPDTEREVMIPLMEADLVVWDDLGTGRPTEWVRETIRIVLNHRYTEGRLTILTTNYPLKTADAQSEDLWKGYGTKPGMSLTERIGIRVYSRILEMAEVVEVKGPDARVHILKAGQDFQRDLAAAAPASPPASSPTCPDCGSRDVTVLDRMPYRRSKTKTDCFCECRGCRRQFTARFDATRGKFEYPKI